MNPSVKDIKDKQFCRICKLSFQGLKKHLQIQHPEISMSQYKKRFGINVNTIDVLLDKFQCGTEEELAEILATSREGVLRRLKDGTTGRNIQRAYEIIAILLERMTDDQLKKSLMQIRFLMDTE